MPTSTIMPCLYFANGEVPDTVGWYAVTVEDRNAVVEVVSTNWGLSADLGQRRFQVGDTRLVFKAQLFIDRIKDPQADQEAFYEAQIATMRGFLEQPGREDDPIGSHQWADRIKDTEEKLAALREARTSV